MTDLFLNPDQLEQLTGCKRSGDQIAWLRDRGYPVEVSKVGRPVVLTAEVEARLSSTVARRAEPEPNWGALKQAG